MDYILCRVICYDWSCDWVSRLVIFNHMLLCLDSNIFPYLLDLISSSLTIWSNFFPYSGLSELLLIPYSLLLLIIQTPMFFPSPSLIRWWKTLTNIWLKLWLVRPRPHAKFTRTLYPYIPGGFNYSDLFGTFDRSEAGITSSAFYVEVYIICIWRHFQCQRVTPPLSHDYIYTDIIRLSYVDFYNHLDVIHVRIFRTPLLTHHLF